MAADLSDGNGKRFRGHYIGTKIDHKWWKRYRHGSFGWRGNGEYWFTDEAFYFRKLISKAPLEIPYSAITAVTIGSWHAGKWLAGGPIVKIDWKNQNGAMLTSGVGLGSGDLARDLVSEIQRRSNGMRPNS